MEDSLYKYVTMDRLKKILIDHKIRFTQPSAFNDPFELVPILLIPKGSVPQGHRSYEFSLSAPRRPIDVDTTDAEDRCSDHHSRDLRESLDREVGFLSLSRTWKSLSMWAHYAEDYTGAVIEFDGSHEFFEWTFDVHYSHDRPVRDLELYGRERIPISEMCNKSTEWEHEEEVRVARCLSDCELSCIRSGIPIYVSKIPHECIKRVIIGERVNQDGAKEVFDIIEHTDIAGDRAVINHWDYELQRMLFKLGPYESGGKKVSSFAYRFYRNFPSL